MQSVPFDKVKYQYILAYTKKIYQFLNNNYITGLFVIHFAFTLTHQHNNSLKSLNIILVIWLISGKFLQTIRLFLNHHFFIFLFLYVSFAQLGLLYGAPYESAARFAEESRYLLLIGVIYTMTPKHYFFPVLAALIGGILYISYYHLDSDFILKQSIQFPVKWYDYMVLNFLYAMAGSILFSLFFIYIKKAVLSQKVIGIIFFLLFCFILYLMLFTMGRSGLAGLLFGVFLVLLFQTKGIMSKFILMIFFSLFLFGAYKLSPVLQKRIDTTITSLDKISTQNNFRSSTGLRLLFWKAGFEIFSSSPIWGVGTGKHTQILKEKVNEGKYLMPKNLASTNFHSKYMEILTQHGLIGFTFFIMMLFYWHRNVDREYKIIALFFGTTTLIALFGANFLDNYGPMMFVVVVMALLLDKKGLDSKEYFWKKWRRKKEVATDVKN